MSQRNVSSGVVSNAALLLPALRLMDAIRNTQPTRPVVGVCLEGDTTLRLTTTVELFRAGRIDHVIVSGGVPLNMDTDQIPAANMKEFLVDHGLPERVIHLEDQSTVTDHHPAFVRRIAKAHGFTELMIITSGYHLLRAYLRFLKDKLVEDFPAGLYGYPAGSLRTWFQNTKSGGRRRAVIFCNLELAKIREYGNLASFDDAWRHIRAFKTTLETKRESG